MVMEFLRSSVVINMGTNEVVAFFSSKEDADDFVDERKADGDCATYAVYEKEK